MLSPTVRVAPSAASRATSLLRSVQFDHPPSCPCHSNPSFHLNRSPGTVANNLRRHLATPVDPSRQKEYAFEMAASSIRFGAGATREVGMDLKNMGAKRVCVVTDETVEKLDTMSRTVDALIREGIEFSVFNKVRIEPKDYS